MPKSHSTIKIGFYQDADAETLKPLLNSMASSSKEEKMKFLNAAEVGERRAIVKLTSALCGLLELIWDCGGKLIIQHQ